MSEREMTNAEIVSILQSRGIDVNPNAKKADLLEQLQKLEGTDKIEKVEKAEIEKKNSSSTDMEKLMGMMSTIMTKIDSIDKRVTSVETNGKGDFKLSVKEADVQSATKSKEGVDSRIVKIVEDILGVDFGVEIMPNPNSPGFQFSVLVPERLSEIKRSTRPVRNPEDPEKYLLDKNGRVVEEEYWPGDKRSRSIGSTDSFDVIRDQCNRVRSYIISYYEKNKKPVPEFRLK